MASHGAALQEYICEKSKWSISTFNSVDWANFDDAEEKLLAPGWSWKCDHAGNAVLSVKFHLLSCSETLHG